VQQRDVVVLGSTGSVGTQALEVARSNPGRFRVVGLSAGGGDVELLARQALEHAVEVVAVARATAVQDLQLAFYAEAQRHGYAKGEFAIPKIIAGPDAASELAARRCDVVLNAITGSVGCGRHWPRWTRGPRWRWRTRSRWSSAVRWSPRWRSRTRSCRSTPSTARSRSACAAAGLTRYGAWC